MGFACKWSEVHPKKGIISTEGLNTGGTTLTFLKKQNRDVAEQKLWDVMKNNVMCLHNLVKKVSTLSPELRMVRLTSDVLCAYTHPDFMYFYKQSDVINAMERWFAPIGETARKHDVRLSFHPDQFVVLASDRPEVVEQSIREFEYHVDMARMMGYGKTFQDFKINVHIAGRQGPEGIRRAYRLLSPEARNTLTIENEEISYGLDDCLTICDLVPIVLDIHHHWIREGEYISANDPRIQKVIDSWRGVRPAIHYSVSREDCLVGHDPNALPQRNLLMESGHNKQNLRAHSDYYWNNAVNDWALTHRSWADMMCESKAKNLASFKLHEYANTTSR